MTNNFKGWLLKFGSNEMPMRWIQKEGWDSTPNQRVDLEAYRDANLLLHRTVGDDTKTSLKITTVPMLLTEKLEFDAIVGLATLPADEKKERRVQVTYWNDELMDYATGTFYMPDINYKIEWVEKGKNEAHYKPFTIELIEY